MPRFAWATQRDCPTSSSSSLAVRRRRTSTRSSCRFSSRIRRSSRTGRSLPRRTRARTRLVASRSSASPIRAQPSAPWTRSPRCRPSTPPVIRISRGPALRCGGRCSPPSRRISTAYRRRSASRATPRTLPPSSWPHGCTTSSACPSNESWIPRPSRSQTSRSSSTTTRPSRCRVAPPRRLHACRAPASKIAP